MTTREIDERIARAFEMFGAIVDATESDCGENCAALAAELRAAEPASEPWECPSCDFACAGKIGIFGGHTDCYGKRDHLRVGCVVVPKRTPAPWPERVSHDAPAPPPSLVERLRKGEKPGCRCLWCEAADALEAAQADSRRLRDVIRAIAHGTYSGRELANAALCSDWAKVDATMERKP